MAPIVCVFVFFDILSLPMSKLHCSSSSILRNVISSVHSLVLSAGSVGDRCCDFYGMQDVFSGDTDSESTLFTVCAVLQVSDYRGETQRRPPSPWDSCSRRGSGGGGSCLQNDWWVYFENIPSRACLRLGDWKECVAGVCDVWMLNSLSVSVTVCANIFFRVPLLALIKPLKTPWSSLQALKIA